MTRHLFLAAGVALTLTVLSAGAGASDSAGLPPECAAPPTLLAIEPTLTRVAARIERRDKVTIVALGSSSTQGVGASSPAATYPSRLETELRERLPQVDFRVINRGKGGEDAPEELARLERDVITEKPDLVIWQIGTNAMLRREDWTADRDAIRRGVALLQQSASDVILMDMQYAPRVIARPMYIGMQRLIADVAAHAHIGLFRRFDIMRHWQAEVPQAETLPVIGPDGLHMTDHSYACLAETLAEAITLNLREHERQANRARAERTARLLSAADLFGGEDP